MTINKEVKIKNKIKSLYKELEEIQKNKTWKCFLCKKCSKISTLILTTFYYYSIEDWECGLDPLLEIYCPKCNRLCQFRDKDLEKIYFKDHKSKDSETGNYI